MGFVGKVLWVFGVWAVFIGGCGDVESSNRRSFTWGFTSWDGPGSPQPYPPVVNAKLCEEDTNNCVFSDASGRVSELMLPVGREIVLTFEREEYPSYLISYVMQPAGGQHIGSFTVPTNVALGEQYQNMMSVYPLKERGSIDIQVWPNLAGVRFRLLGATGTAYYLDQELSYRTDLTETTSVGWAGFVDVTEGEFEIEIHESSGRLCGPYPSFGWPGSEENTIKLPVRAGYTTFARVVCDGGATGSDAVGDVATFEGLKGAP